MRRALAEVLLAAVPAGLLGTWVVMRRLAFFAHALGHATFPALVVAAIMGWSVFAAALAASTILALGIGALSERPELADGAAVGVALSAAVALGAVLVSDVADPGIGADTLLFGSVLAIGSAELVRTAVVAGVVVAAVALAGRAWTAIAFERAGARAMGLPARALDALLLVLLAGAVSASVSVMGSLMAAALLLAPAATARLVTTRVSTLAALSVAIAALDGAAGLWIAVRTGAPPGACIGALAAGLFLAVALARAAVARIAAGSGDQVRSVFD
jgi:ABC-type Mn2+/Zn2+ transport system permease subunit